MNKKIARILVTMLFVSALSGCEKAADDILRWAKDTDGTKAASEAPSTEEQSESVSENDAESVTEQNPEETSPPVTTAAQTQTTTAQTQAAQGTVSNQQRYNDFIEKYAESPVKSYFCSNGERSFFFAEYTDLSVREVGNTMGEGTIFAQDMGTCYCKWYFMPMRGYVFDIYALNLDDGEYYEYDGFELSEYDPDAAEF